MKKTIIILFFFSKIIHSQVVKTADSVKTTELKEVVLEIKKKAVEQKADRIIYNFSEQSYLNSGTLMEGLKKLPGLIISDVAGMMYQGKLLEVYMDGRPLNMYSDELNTFMESLPANSIEKVEIITQPGAEFPATSGGAIVNIITSKNSKKYTSITYSNGFGFTKYYKPRTRFNNSVLINAKNNIFAWQVQLGQSYSERYQLDSFNTESLLFSKNYTDKINNLYFLKTGFKFNLKQDRILFNYDFNTNNNNSYLDAFGYNFSSNDESKSKRNNNNLTLVYQKRFDDISKKLDISFNYNVNKSNFNLYSRNSNFSILDNISDQSFYQVRADYSNEINFLDETKFSIGALADRLDFITESFDIVNLKYIRSTVATYSEVQSSYKSFDFILGSRIESYSITGNTDTNKLNTFKQTRLFPNATIQYNVMDDVFINANYNKKISLPNTSSLNPNNTSYQNQNVTFFGNPNLDPTIFDNYEIKMSAMEYFSIGYSISNASNQIANRIIETNNGAANVTENISKVSIHDFNFGFPIPFMLFTKGIKKTLEFDFNPDEINFLYLYLEHQKNYIENIDTKGFWNLNLMMQIILPKNINFTTNYNTTTTGGNYFNYYVINRPLNQQFDITFSKKFLSNNLSISLYTNDVFNTNKKNISAVGTDFIYQNKYDSRRVGFSLNYKFPPKNKTIKEENIIIEENNKEESYDKLKM